MEDIKMKEVVDNGVAGGVGGAGAYAVPILSTAAPIALRAGARGMIRGGIGVAAGSVLRIGARAAIAGATISGLGSAVAAGAATTIIVNYAIIPATTYIYSSISNMIFTRKISNEAYNDNYNPASSDSLNEKDVNNLEEKDNLADLEINLNENIILEDLPEEDLNIHRDQIQINLDKSKVSDYNKYLTYIFDNINEQVNINEIKKALRDTSITLRGYLISIERAISSTRDLYIDNLQGIEVINFKITTITRSRTMEFHINRLITSDNNFKSINKILTYYCQNKINVIDKEHHNLASLDP